MAKNRLRDALVDWPPADIDAHIAIGYPGYWLGYDHDTHSATRTYCAQIDVGEKQPSD